MEFETRAIHAGQEPDPLTGAVNVPIYQTSTYAQDGVLQMRGGHDYARTINPTRTALETCLAALEGGKHGVCFSSGHGRDDRGHGALRARARAPSRSTTSTAAPTACSRRCTPRRATRYEFVDLTDEGIVRSAFEQPADLVWLETPSNPLLKIVDIAAVAERAHAAGALVVVDNTFASPYLQQPLALGADIVVHSTTKYVGGHSDSVGGAVIVNDDEPRASGCTSSRTRWAPCPARSTASSRCAAPRRSPCAWSATATTRPRSRAGSTESPAVSEVFYPGLESHPGHETAQRQMRRFGGMIAFRVHGGRAAVDAALSETGVWTLGESLGGVESLIEHPGAMTHASLAGSGFEVPDDLIRLSVGIEHVDDLLHDLVTMLANATRARMSIQ